MEELIKPLNDSSDEVDIFMIRCKYYLDNDIYVAYMTEENEMVTCHYQDANDIYREISIERKKLITLNHT